MFFAHCAAVAEFEYSVNLQTGHDPMSESSNDSFTADCHFLLSTVFDLDSAASNLGHASQPGTWMHAPAHYNTTVSCGVPSSQLSEPPTRYFSKDAHIQIGSHLFCSLGLNGELKHRFPWALQELSVPAVLVLIRWASLASMHPGPPTDPSIPAPMPLPVLTHGCFAPCHGSPWIAHVTDALPT